VLHRRLAPIVILLAAAAAVVVVAAAGRSAEARVSPLNLIDQQIQKANMLILLDTSGSMVEASGEDDLDFHETGPDCDEGSRCRIIGQPGRCFITAAGRMGAGASRDLTSCTTDAQCRFGWCKKMGPEDCSAAGVCEEAGERLCTTDADCPSGTPCATVANDRCWAGPTEPIRLCRQTQSRCRSDADCTAVPNDTCGPASSRLVIAKRALRSVVSQYKHVLNFGFMSFTQSGYFPYSPLVGATSTLTEGRYFDRAELEAAGCFSVAGGPAATCVVNGTTYTLRAANNSRYRVHLGGSSFLPVDHPHCANGSLQCVLSTGQGTGEYRGSHYTFTVVTGTGRNSDWELLPTYRGKTTTIDGSPYVYFESSDTRFNLNGISDNRTVNPIDGPVSSSPCNASSGARWESGLVPFLDSTGDPARADAMALAISARLQKVSYGGLTAVGSTPSGCSLFNSGAPARETSAYHYMQSVKATDALACRRNYVLFVTDGRPNAMGETACDSAACGTDSLAGCTCASVLAASRLYRELGVKTYVIAFSKAVGSGYAAAAMRNLARAGGTERAYGAINENELQAAISSAIFDAVRGSYATSPATAMSSEQSGSTVSFGTLLLDARVDFPSWKGDLIAYDVSGAAPALTWSASTVSFDAASDPAFWKKRNVWTSNGGAMVKIEVDQATGAITNAATLRALGFGATDAEAALVARWMLGDPAMKNPAVLGAILSSTPIDVGPPGVLSQPGGSAFHARHRDRPRLVYVGASDGMLHAFFTESTTVGGRAYRGGQEAFAYVPPEMIPVIKRLFVQGGQLPSPDDHVFGVASSPKVKDVCTAHCTDPALAVWKTLLAVNDGFGGRELFVLDVSEPHGATGIRSGAADPPVRLVWHSADVAASASLDARLGLTLSTPALSFGKTATLDDHRLLVASGYGDGVHADQGKALLSIGLVGGGLLDVQAVPAASAAACAGSYALLTDVATARDYGAHEQGQLLAAYAGDTAGNIWRYVPGRTDGQTTSTGTLGRVTDLGCAHPLHLAPAVVQLDRDSAGNRSGEIYLVQATNSAFDPETEGFAPSKLVFRRDLAQDGLVTADETFGAAGSIALVAGAAGQLCGDLETVGAACGSKLPAIARPTATPIAILREDGTGFQVLSSWYAPSQQGCDKGTSYILLHELRDGAVTQRRGLVIANEPVTGVVFVGGKLLYTKEGGAVELTGFFRGQVVKPGQVTAGSASSTSRFGRGGWQEVF
jgi:hypothetical protein